MDVGEGVWSGCIVWLRKCIKVCSAVCLWLGECPKRFLAESVFLSACILLCEDK